MNSQIFCLFVILSVGLNAIVSVQGGNATNLTDIRNTLTNFFKKFNTEDKDLIPETYKKLKNEVTKNGILIKTTTIKNEGSEKQLFTQQYNLIVKHSLWLIEKIYIIRVEDAVVLVTEEFYEDFEKRYQKLTETVKIKETFDEKDENDKSLMEQQNKLLEALEKLKSAVDYAKDNITTISYVGENLLELIAKIRQINKRLKSPDEFQLIIDEVPIKSGKYYISNTKHMFSQFNKEYGKLVDLFCKAITNLEKQIKDQNITFAQSESDKIRKLIEEYYKDIKGPTNDFITAKQKQLKDKLTKFQEIIKSGESENMPKN